MALEGRGQVGLWGASPALNLNNYIECKNEERNVLLIGSADPRHILASLEKQSENYLTNFYVIESQAPLIARTMLIFEILFNNDQEYSVQGMAWAYRVLTERESREISGSFWQYSLEETNF